MTNILVCPLSHTSIPQLQRMTWGSDKKQNPTVWNWTNRENDAPTFKYSVLPVKPIQELKIVVRFSCTQKERALQKKGSIKEEHHLLKQNFHIWESQKILGKLRWLPTTARASLNISNEGPVLCKTVSLQTTCPIAPKWRGREDTPW